MNPPFDEQFVIYRYKRILSEEFIGDGEKESQSMFESSDKKNSNSKSALDIMQKFAYESSYRQLDINIERCA